MSIGFLEQLQRQRIVDPKAAAELRKQNKAVTIIQKHTRRLFAERSIEKQGNAALTIQIAYEKYEERQNKKISQHTTIKRS